ncbi:MAG TPA: TrkA C-terminal domain-containing protein, partial [Acidimicrobiales bacterium]|nr:TrkA C-terminal domain-containing protein [Acidimicrobiales bacterium]
ATVSWTTDQVLRRLFPEVSVAEWTHSSGAMSLIERSLPKTWAGRKLVDVVGESDKFRLVALSRGGQARLASADLVGQEGDILHVVVHREATEELETRLSGDGGS